jgi:hypothetical protein
VQYEPAEYGQRKVERKFFISNVEKGNIIFVKNVNVLANSIGSRNTSSRGTDLGIVIYHECSVVSNYPIRYR